MRTAAIVSCSEHKRATAMPAEELYSSERFILARRYAQARYDQWLILSAKHGILEPGDTIEPYDVSLASLSPVQFQDLAKRVKRQLVRIQQRLRPLHITSLCEEAYGSVLAAAGLPFTSDVLGALPPAKRLDALRQRTDPNESEPDLDVVYGLVDRLAAVPLRDAIHGLVPPSGVYLFFEAEERRLRDLSKLRLVRVGTHGVANGSKASLRDRLRTHFGTGLGGGNHRSSIFRLHVGRSLMRRGLAPDLSSWGCPSPPSGSRTLHAEAEVERLVSRYLGDFLVAFIEVPGVAEKTNDRAYLEQSLIALLSNAFSPLDPPAHQWLGSWSDKSEIRRSGLWNVNHTAQRYDRRFLALLEYYVAATVAGQPIGRKPKTPPDWAARAREDHRQLSLL